MNRDARGFDSCPGLRASVVACCLLVFFPTRGAQPAETIDRSRVKAEHDSRTALTLLERQLEQARRASDHAQASSLLGQLTSVHQEMGEFEKARQAAAAAVEAARRSGDPGNVAASRLALGDAYFELLDFERALDEYRTGYGLFREIGDRYREAQALKNIGILYRHLSRHEEGVVALEEACTMLREFGEPVDVASALENLGRSYSALGDEARGFEAVSEAVVFARRSGDERSILHALVRLADGHAEVGFPELALEPLTEAVALAERLGMWNQHEWALSGLSQMLAAVGRLDEAIETGERALVIAGRLSEDRLANALFKMGSVVKRRDPRQALDYLQRSRSAFERIGLRTEWWLYAELAETHRRLGDLDLAVDLYYRAVELLESVRSGIVSEPYRASYLEKHEAVYRDLIEVLWERHVEDPQRGDDARAFEILERAKARSLVERITESRVDIGWPLDPDLGQRDEELTTRIARLQREIFGGSTSESERKQLLGQLDQAEAALALLIADVRRRNPRYASVRYPDPLSVDEARSLLDGRTAFVAYLESRDRVFAFLLTADRFEIQRLDVAPEVLRTRVETYIELLADQEKTDWQAVSRRLHEELIQPLQDRLPAAITNLIVAPDGALHFLPFETLLAGEQHLIERFNVTYAPSATALRGIEQIVAEGRKDSARDDLLMFANPALPQYTEASGSTPRGTRALYESEGLDISSIPYSGAEARSVRRLARKGSEIYTGAQATEQRLKAALLERFRVVHFATHGLISRRWPARSALLLAPGDDGREDGFLQVREIYRLRLSSDLVVLSACRTARGPVLAGEGVQGLAQAFLHAGSRAVLASLWDVDDDRTERSMRRFYEQLDRGLPPAEALRRTKLGLIRAGAAPRDWAPFVLIGSGARPIPLKGAPWWEAWLGLWPLVLGIFVAGILLRRARVRPAPDRSTTFQES